LDLLELKVELVEHKLLNLDIFILRIYIVFLYPSLKFYIVNKDDEIVWTIFREMEIKDKDFYDNINWTG